MTEAKKKAIEAKIKTTIAKRDAEVKKLKPIEKELGKVTTKHEKQLSVISKLNASIDEMANSIKPAPVEEVIVIKGEQVGKSEPTKKKRSKKDDLPFN
jgi:hypothetical protein